MVTSTPSSQNYFQLPPAQQSQPVQSVPQSNTYQPAPNNQIYDVVGMGKSPETQQFQEQPENTSWYANSNLNESPVKEEDSWWGGMWDNLWGWAGSEQGTAVLGGALDMAGGLWLADQKAGIARGLPSGGGEGPSAAELQDARYAKHNVSINKPIEMGVRKFKR